MERVLVRRLNEVWLMHVHLLLDNPVFFWLDLEPDPTLFIHWAGILASKKRLNLYARPHGSQVINWGKKEYSREKFQIWHWSKKLIKDTAMTCLLDFVNWQIFLNQSFISIIKLLQNIPETFEFLQFFQKKM